MFLINYLFYIPIECIILSYSCNSYFDKDKKIIIIVQNTDLTLNKILILIQNEIINKNTKVLYQLLIWTIY